MIDAKYKRATSTDYPNADAYQMLAYCSRLGLAEGWLIYADLDGGEPQSQTIRQADVTLRIDSIDLAGDIDDLHTSVASLARRIQRGLLAPSR